MRVDCFDGVIFAEVMVDDAAVTVAETAEGKQETKETRNRSEVSGEYGNVKIKLTERSSQCCGEI